MSGITSYTIQRLWNKVQVKPEWATTKFWGYILQQTFRGGNWIISSSQPPTDNEDDLRRVSFVVEDGKDTMILLVMLTKRANAGTDLVQEIEYQAYAACCAYLVHSGRSSVWAMTCVGSAARIWAFRQGEDYITQYWPPARAGFSNTIREYAEFSVQGMRILECLESINHTPVPDASIFENPPAKRPPSPRLPESWHDREARRLRFCGLPSQTRAAEGLGSSTAQRQLPGLPLAMGSSSGAFDSSNGMELVVRGASRGVYICDNVGKGTRISMPQQGWRQCDIRSAGGRTRSGYVRKNTSGAYFYAWTLKPETRNSRKLTR